MNYGTAQKEFDSQSTVSITRSWMKPRTVDKSDLQPVNVFEAALRHMRSVRQVEAYRGVVEMMKNTVINLTGSYLENQL